MTDQLLQATVVLPTQGRRPSLVRVLQALGVQTVRPGTFEVVVVCDGDIDGSAEACRSLRSGLPYKLRVVEQPRGGPAAARNVGVSVARASLIIFIDDDVIPDKNLIDSHLKAQAGQENLVAIGPLLPPPDARLSTWAAFEERTLCKQYDDMKTGRWSPTWRQFYTGNASLLRQHILGIGGFNVEYFRAEDVELALRLAIRGHHFKFLPEARGWHYICRSFASWTHIPDAYGKATVAMAQTYAPWLLDANAREYRSRHLATRAIVQACVGRKVAFRVAVTLLGATIQVIETIRWIPRGDLLCSLLFNLKYYDSLAAALGGRQAFEALVQDREAPVVLRSDDTSTR